MTPNDATYLPSYVILLPEMFLSLIYYISFYILSIRQATSSHGMHVGPTVPSLLAPTLTHVSYLPASKVTCRHLPASNVAFPYYSHILFNFIYALSIYFFLTFLFSIFSIQLSLFVFII
jgi:hypothetical protein